MMMMMMMTMLLVKNDSVYKFLLLVFIPIRHLMKVRSFGSFVPFRFISLNHYNPMSAFEDSETNKKIPLETYIWVNLMLLCLFF